MPNLAILASRETSWPCARAAAWRTTMNLRNGCRISPSRSGTGSAPPSRQPCSRSQAAHRSLHRQAGRRIDLWRRGLPRRSADLGLLLIATGADGRGIHAHPRQTPHPQKSFCRMVVRCFSGGCSATSANAISAPAERASGRPSRRSFVCFAMTATKFDEPQRRVANG